MTHTPCAELLPCPFCGGVPERDGCSWPDGDSSLYIRCSNKKCSVRPSVSWDEDDRVGEGKLFHPDELSEAWNTRPAMGEVDLGRELHAERSMRQDAEGLVDQLRKMYRRIEEALLIAYSNNPLSDYTHKRISEAFRLNNSDRLDAATAYSPKDHDEEDPAEAAYWRFDARRKGYAGYLHVGERYAFKQEYRAALSAAREGKGEE